MATLAELRNKRFTIWEGMKEILDTRSNEYGDLSAEDAATYARMENEYDAIAKNIERFERQANLDGYYMNDAPILHKPDNTFSLKTGTASNEYKQAFISGIRNNFRQVSDYLQESVSTDGGFLVPDEWDSQLLTSIEDECVMRQLGTTITTSGLHRINVAGSRPTGAWLDEGDTLNFTDTSFSQITLDAYKLQVGTTVTNELLEDNKYDLESHLIREFAREFAAKEEDAFLNGATDTHTPTGLFVTATADTDSVVTTSGANIAADDILNLVYKLDRGYRKKAVFILNDATLAIIRKFKTTDLGYIWQPSYQAGEPDMLLGYKVYTSTYAPKIAANTSVVAFGDMSAYTIAERGSRRFYTLRESFMTRDMTGFALLERVDGKLIDKNAVKVLKIKP